jgi:hypothetical protein
MKKLFLIPLISILFLASAAFSDAAEKEPIFTVDGKTVAFNESTGFPYITDTGSAMMPLRECFTSIGCSVDWNQETQTVKSHKGGIEIEIPVGSREIRINQKTVLVDTAAVLKNGHTYLPLRAVMEAYGYNVNWDPKTSTVSVTAGASSNIGVELTPFLINGGTTGIFSRKQLHFAGFDGIEGDITLPLVPFVEKGDCPYLYFGFDWKNDVGNVEGGFQFIVDSNHPDYNKWTVFMRQGNDWRWGDHIVLEQGSVHHLKFYSEAISEKQVDLVIELDGREIIRKVSAVTDFTNASVKTVTAMGMTKSFDGTNCESRTENSKIENVKVSMLNSDQYYDFTDHVLYSEWKPTVGAKGTWFGTADCIPSYLHVGMDGAISIYKDGVQ